MRVGTLVQSRLNKLIRAFGVVLEFDRSGGGEIALVHWNVLVLDGTLDPYQYIHDLEIICE